MQCKEPSVSNPVRVHCLFLGAKIGFLLVSYMDQEVRQVVNLSQKAFPKIFWISSGANRNHNTFGR